MSDILTDNDVADLLHCTPETVQEWTRCGKLPGIKPGRHWVYPRAALMEALNDLAREQKPDRPRTLHVVKRKAPPLLPKPR